MILHKPYGITGNDCDCLDIAEESEVVECFDEETLISALQGGHISPQQALYMHDQRINWHIVVGQEGGAI